MLYKKEQIYKKYKEKINGSPSQYIGVFFKKIYKTKIRPAKAGEKIDLLFMGSSLGGYHMVEPEGFGLF